VLGSCDHNVQLLRTVPGPVQLDSVSHRYRGQAEWALEDITLTLEPGVTGLVGANGAGKSTLLGVLAGAVCPTLGSTRGCGSGHQIGWVPQELALPSTVRVLDFLVYMAWVQGIGRRDRLRLAEVALAEVDLTALSGSRIGALSGGMRRRLLIGQALLTRPEVLLMDEPTAGLDPEQRARMRALVDTLSSGDRVLVVSSHEIADLAHISDRLVMLERGRVVFDGTPHQMHDLGSALTGIGAAISPYEAAFLQLRAGGESPG
jgi:ABC-2 type transport system ATP-binding protein